MQRLILLRHGKTEAVSASGADIDRGLTDRGFGDAGLMARWLAAAGLTPDLALVSDARRTRQTWAVFAETFPSARVAFDPALYLASADRIADAIENAAEHDLCLVVIGHNPGLHDLALTYAFGDRGPEKDRLLDGFPTAAAAVFVRAAGDRWRLEQAMTPRDARGDLP